MVEIFCYSNHHLPGSPRSKTKPGQMWRFLSTCCSYSASHLRCCQFWWQMYCRLYCEVQSPSRNWSKALNQAAIISAVQETSVIVCDNMVSALTSTCLQFFQPFYFFFQWEGNQSHIHKHKCWCVVSNGPGVQVGSSKKASFSVLLHWKNKSFRLRILEKYPGSVVAFQNLGWVFTWCM